MLKIYGLPVSSPTNKVRYVANYLNIPHEFNIISLSRGEHKKPEYLKINPLGRIPAIDDEGFRLAESNAICRYLADKQQSDLYPKDLKKRAVIDQWMDYASLHVLIALARIMFNTYFYKFVGIEKDERAIEDGRKFIAEYLPIIEQQLSQHKFIADDKMTLADIAMIASLDTCEMAQVNLTAYPHLVKWRTKLMSENFYQKCHANFAEAFNNLIAAKA